MPIFEVCIPNKNEFYLLCTGLLHTMCGLPSPLTRPTPENCVPDLEWIGDGGRIGGSPSCLLLPEVPQTPVTS